jgi:hypothetical protein
VYALCLDQVVLSQRFLSAMRTVAPSVFAGLLVLLVASARTVASRPGEPEAATVPPAAPDGSPAPERGQALNSTQPANGRKGRFAG